MPIYYQSLSKGWVAEWFKAHAWKVCVGLKAYREFESLPIRHYILHDNLHMGRVRYSRLESSES